MLTYVLILQNELTRLSRATRVFPTLYTFGMYIQQFRTDTLFWFACYAPLFSKTGPSTRGGGGDICL